MYEDSETEETFELQTIFKEIPALREYLEQNFEPGTKKHVISDLQGERSVQAFDTMLQVAFRCSFITTCKRNQLIGTVTYDVFSERGRRDSRIGIPFRLSDSEEKV